MVVGICLGFVVGGEVAELNFGSGEQRRKSEASLSWVRSSDLVCVSELLKVVQAHGGREKVRSSHLIRLQAARTWQSPPIGISLVNAKLCKYGLGAG